MPTPRPIGFRIVRTALVALAATALASTAWILWKAAENPDVRAKRPSWLDPATPFDFPYWLPLVLTVTVGSALVGWVLWRAYRRMRAGEDLYAGRFGRGLRRRSERFLDEP